MLTCHACMVDVVGWVAFQCMLPTAMGLAGKLKCCRDIFASTEVCLCVCVMFCACVRMFCVHVIFFVLYITCLPLVSRNEPLNLIAIAGYIAVVCANLLARKHQAIRRMNWRRKKSMRRSRL